MTEIRAFNDETLALAATTIRSGGLVAFPTETVYGLGADSFNAKAVTQIFAAKGRPSFNPLISHISSFEMLEDLAVPDSRAQALAKKFWPGPLTLILPRRQSHSALDLVCAGLPNISVRMPSHPIALALITAAATPIAAPSANRSQTISPTCAQHVADSLFGQVDLILDGGACKIGVESTIVNLTTKDTVILRAGGLSKEALEEFLGEKVLLSQGNPNLPTSPGQMLKHYAPRLPTRINVTPSMLAEDEFYIGFGVMDGNLNLSPSGDTTEAAANLFSFMHQAETQTLHPKIAIAPIPDYGLGLAINDRIKRASYQG
ncbi:MAG: threonylcarbamoyl-AMP synthase [Alphaproteobacteria bacterium]|nr:threonylcarbamoyl-AMP synthase [Alphaproteobacteria bacterium]